MTTIKIPAGSSIDPYLKSNRNNTEFRLESGTYVTGGNWAFDGLDHTMLGPGCRLIGAGSGSTRIWCDPVLVNPKAAQHEAITAGSRTYECGFVEVSGVSIQCPRSPKIGNIGLHVWSDRCIVRDVEVCGLSGYRSMAGEPSRESFGILINRSGKPQDVGGSIVENVTIRTAGTMETENYCCGLYVGIVEPEHKSFVRNAVVTNYHNAPAHAAFGTNGGVIWTACSNDGCWNRAIFCDTAGGNGTIFSACHLVAGSVAVEFRGPDGIEWRNIMVSGCVIEAMPYVDSPYRAGLVLARDGKVGPKFKNVTLQSCQLVPSAIGRAELYVGSIDNDNVEACGTRDCTAIGWRPTVIGNTVTRHSWRDINLTT